MNKLFKSKLYYNVNDKCSYIHYNDTIYIVNDDDIKCMDHAFEESIIVADIISNKRIINTCSFYHLMNFVANRLDSSNDNQIINKLNLFLFHKEFYFEKEKSLMKLTQIRKKDINIYEYKFESIDKLKFIIELQF